MSGIVLKVEGMACDGCAKAVRRAIDAAAPGSVAEVDHATGRVAVTGAADVAALSAAIEKAGYSVVDAQAA